MQDNVNIGLYELFSDKEVQDGLVLRRGKIFETGEWPDHNNFSLTPEEMGLAASDFKPVPIDLSHLPQKGIETVLDGKLGHLQAVEVADDGHTLFGTVAIPKWLDDLYKDTELKVSATWNTLSKRLAGLALVTKPAIEDAAIFTAFEQSIGQHTAADQSDGFTTVVDLQVTIPNEEISNMSKVEDNKVETPDVAEFAAQMETMRQQMVELQKQNEKLRGNQRKASAEKLADEIVDANRAIPAERDMIASIVEQAMIDDEDKTEKAAALATFGVAKAQATRVSALKSMFAARPSLEKLIEDDEVEIETDESGETAIFARKTPKAQDKQEGGPVQVSAERRKQLMGHTVLGNALLEG